MSSLAPEPAGNNPTRATEPPRTNRWYVLFSVFLGAYVLYVVVVAARAWGGAAEAAPRPLNAIVLTALSMCTVVALLFGWRHERRAVDADRLAREVTRDEQTAAWQSAVMDKITALQEAAASRRLGDDTTVNLAGHSASFRPEGRVLYASLMGIHNGPMDVLMEAVGKKVDERFTAIKDEIEEFGNQRFYKGYAACAEDASGGSVRALSPRNGHRSTS